jgi:exodeoxyribonuclease VII large subunit
LAESDFHIFSVEEITLYIKNQLSSDENLNDIWIEGEISNFVCHSSGHFYFTLKDKSSQLPCAMFKWANEQLKFKLKDGMQVLVKGTVDVYTPQGRYNFIVSTVHPKGKGELYLKFMQLKEKLLKEGLFSVEHKKALPKIPRKIGVITSPTGAAIRDIINVTARRFPLCEILVVPTLVQGKDAKEDIVHSIELLNMRSDVDVAIVGRGGGSIEDLWPFNEELVARGIFDSDIPIISAVGHETDFSISDFVADLRAPTPSAAAELAVPDKNQILRDINSKMESLVMNMKGLIKLNQKHLDGTTTSLRPKLLLDRIIQYQQHSDDTTSKMIMQMQHSMALYEGKFRTLSEMLDAVSPLSTLSRGYSIAQRLPTETVIESVDRVKVDDSIKVILHDGELNCIVNDVKRIKRKLKNKDLEV